MSAHPKKWYVDRMVSAYHDNVEHGGNHHNSRVVAWLAISKNGHSALGSEREALAILDEVLRQ